MSAGQLVQLAVCTDCLTWIANGEGDPNWTEEELAAYLVDFGRGSDGLSFLSPGSLHKDCTHTAGEDCPEDEGWFSWSPCDICRRPLGGSRYPATAEIEGDR